MVKPVYSQHFEAVRSRIKRLPQLLQAEVENLSYNDAVRLVELFKDGIKKRNFHTPLKQLKPDTIKSKERRNYVSPENPLYGTFRYKNRFNNMMGIFRDGQRWIVKPRDGKYHPRKNKDGEAVESTLTLAQMFDVHEYGATIAGKTRSGTAMRIRIPPRPAFRYAYNILMREKARNDDAEKLREKIRVYIDTGRWKSAARRNLKDT